MKDSANIELIEGDLVLLTIDTPIEHPAELIIFIENEEYVYDVTEDGEEKTITTNKVKYYPINKEGLQVAKFDAGVTQTDFHRQKKFIVTNICSKNLLKLDSNTLTGYNKTLFDSIVALL